MAAPQVARGLLAAADRGEGVTLYRYYEPPPGSPQQQLLQQQRGRMGRRFRLAPPGEAELRQWFGMPPGQAADAAAAGAAGQPLPGEKPGFTVAASDACCRSAVGAVALAAAPAAGDGSPAYAAPALAAAAAAAAAAVLEAGGLFSVLQQRWPRHEPALHQRCAFKLGELAAALLPGSLSYAGDPSSSSSQGAGAASAAELAAVTASGAVVALLPLPPQQAQQLLLLQPALAQHPTAAPLSGGSHAAFRGTDGSARQQPLFKHPLPLNATAAAATAAAPPSPDAAAAQQQLALCFLVDGPAAPSPGAGGGGIAVQWPSSAAGRAASQAPPFLAASPSAQQQRQQVAAVDAVLDADILQQYLLLPPAEQQRLLAGALACDSRAPGEGGEAEGLPQQAAQLSNLVAQLLL
jgi:hypothetical protein